MELSGRHLSVDAPFQDGEENSLLDVLPSHDTPTTDNKLIEESLAKEIERTLSTLPEKESSVIRAFYGIGTKPMSLEEIGATIGISRERTRQIKEKAIKHLQAEIKKQVAENLSGINNSLIKQQRPRQNAGSLLFLINLGRFLSFKHQCRTARDI